MRIFAAVRHSKAQHSFGGSLWTRNFYPALAELGHEVVESQTDLDPGSRFMDVSGGFTRQENSVREELTNRIVAELKLAHEQKPIGLFLSYFYNSHFHPDGFDEIRRMGIPSVNFYCNSIYQFELTGQVAAKVDFAWHAEKHARASYLAVGARPVWVQMGADPVVYRPHKVGRSGQVCFVGRRYADRDRCAAAVIEAGIPLDLFGDGWGATADVSPVENDNPRHDPSYLGRPRPVPGSLLGYFHTAHREIIRVGPIDGGARVLRQMQYRRKSRTLDTCLARRARGRAPDIAATFAQYQICLNFSNVWADGRPGSKLIPHVRLRDFEGPMSRSCFITGHTDEIEEFYKVGNEIDTYRSTDELIDKLRFYLNHPPSAERLREAGYCRARRDHTWVRRFQQLFGEIGLTMKI
jgi:spore maturation protein CgeB